MIHRVAPLVIALVVGAAATAHAGSIGTVVEAPTDAALALKVSQTYFAPGSVHGVVLADPGEPGTAAIAAAYAGSGAGGRLPLLFTGRGASDVKLRDEIKRVTGGPDGATVWLAGAALGGLEGYDVRDLGDTAGEVAASIATQGPPVGTAGRILVFDPQDWRAGVVAAGFGAAYGIPVIPGGDAVPAAVTSTPLPVAIAVGSVAVPDGKFSRVDRIEGADPAALSAAAADTLVANEHPAGAPLGVPVPVQPVAADGFGTDPGPALLAPVVAAALQADGARPPVFLVDGRPAADLAAGCAGSAKDKAALCALDKADGATTVLALRASNDGGVRAGTLPATGGGGVPVVAFAIALAWVATRRMRTAG